MSTHVRSSIPQIIYDFAYFSAKTNVVGSQKEQSQ